jgi:hypothetical protein
MANSSLTELISSALTPRKPPDFTFITITNPRDIKDSKRQTKIRRHARESTLRLKKQRQIPMKLVFDLDSPVDADRNVLNDPQADALRQDAAPIVGSTEDDISASEDPPFSSQMPSLDFLRPIGAGRGLNPLQPFPDAVDARMRQLIDFGMIATYQIYFVTANHSSTPSR